MRGIWVSGFGSLFIIKRTSHRTRYKTEEPYSLKIRLLVLFCSTQSRGRTGTTLLSLVFETSASTNSAIWAIGCGFECDGVCVNFAMRR